MNTKQKERDTLKRFMRSVIPLFMGVTIGVVVAGSILLIWALYIVSDYPAHVPKSSNSVDLWLNCAYAVGGLLGGLFAGHKSNRAGKTVPQSIAYTLVSSGIIMVAGSGKVLWEHHFDPSMALVDIGAIFLAVVLTVALSKRSSMI